MSNDKELMEGTLKLVADSRKETTPYFHTVAGEHFIVFPEVFSPKYFKDTEFFAEKVPEKAKGQFLEIGTGTGAVAISTFLGKNVEYVTATDINHIAFLNTWTNIWFRGLRHCVGVFEGNIYEPVQDKQFETIFWNVPFGDWPHDNDMLKRAVFDSEQKSLREYIAGARHHLRDKDSNLLIGYSTTLGKYDVLEQLLEEYDFKPLELIAETTSTEGNPHMPVKFELFETYMR